MEKTMSGILIETVVKATLKNLKEDPERGIRNLVDMALRFSGNQFQQDFFQEVQNALKNENSPYYALVRDLASYADAEHLHCFGMNLGYHSCTYGARQIRQNEKELNHNIPWTILFQIGSRSLEHMAQYDAAISDGEKLGIYTWMLLAPGVSCQLPGLIRNHPDSAFFLFCEPEDITDDFLDNASELRNVMLTPRYQEGWEEVYDKIRALGLPYSTCFLYSQDDLQTILNGDLFTSIQQIHPVFAVLLPRPDCPEQFRTLTYQTVKWVRDEQLFQMIPWELEQDNRNIDKIISDDACAVCFDPEGRLLDGNGNPIHPGLCLFEHALTEVLRLACPKETSGVSAQ